MTRYSSEEKRRIRRLLEAFFREHAPSRLGDIDALMRTGMPEIELIPHVEQLYTKDRSETARKRRRLTAFYEQYAPAELSNVQVLLESGTEEAQLFNALYKKYKIPVEAQLYNTTAQKKRRKTLEAFFERRRSLVPQPEVAIETAMEADEPLSVLLPQLRKIYVVSSSAIDGVTSPPPPQEIQLQQSKEMNEGDGRLKLRQRLTEFYSKHCPDAVEKRVLYAMSLDVDEDVLFASLYRRYNLDAGGNPLPDAMGWCKQTTDVATIASSTTLSMVDVAPTKEPLCQRLVAFYAKHSSMNIEAKVRRALALDVSEEELFRALHRQYHLDANGDPIVAVGASEVSIDDVSLTQNTDFQESTTIAECCDTGDTTRVENDTAVEEQEEEEEEEEDKTIGQEAFVSDRCERLREFFAGLNTESRETLLLRWVPPELSVEELIHELEQLQKDNNLQPTCRQSLPLLSTYEEECKGIVASKDVAPHVTSVEAYSSVLLFSRHTRWLVGSEWGSVSHEQLRNALLDDLVACSGWRRENIDVVTLAEADGLNVTFFIECDGSTPKREANDVIAAAKFDSAWLLLSAVTLREKNGMKSASCVKVRCIFVRMKSDVLQHLDDTQRVIFMQALEVDLLAHAAQFGALHLGMGSHMSMNGAEALVLQCEVHFLSNTQAEKYVQSLLEDDGGGGVVYCREARQVFALLGGDPYEVAVAWVSPLPASLASVSVSGSRGVLIDRAGSQLLAHEEGP